MSAIENLPARELSEGQLRNHEKLRRECGEVFMSALNDPLTIEIMLNPDGSLWQERLGEDQKQIGTMTPTKAEAVLRTVAAYLDTTITRDRTGLEGEFPLDGSRFAGGMPPASSPGPYFNIRKKASSIFTLAQYVESGAMTEAQRQAICEAVAQKKNIVISGVTGSGKTTLTNAVIDEVVTQFPRCRFVIIEDTGEIQCAASNFVLLRTTRDADIREQVRRTMRLRPDRILVGEVRGGDALDLLQAWGTHEGGVATVHATSALLTLSRLNSLVSQHADSNNMDIDSFIGSYVQLVIHIKKVNEGGRKVESIMAVDGYDTKSRSYITRYL